METLKKLNRLAAVSLISLITACNTYTDKLSVQAEQPIIPVLTGKDANPIVKIKLIRNIPEAYTIKQIALSLDGTSLLSDIKSVQVYSATDKGAFTTENPITASLPASNKIVFNPNLPIDTDTFICWVSVKLKDTIDLSHKVGIKLTEVSTTLGKVNNSTLSPTRPLRVGVAVRQHQQDGVHTYRIPGLATSTNGTLLALYDARKASSRDLQGDMDICLNRSTDGGASWLPLQIVLDMKTWGGLPEKFNGVSDANVLVDENTGTIYIAGLWMHGILDSKTGKWKEGLNQESPDWIHQWHNKGSQPGLGIKETSQFLITQSTDDGVTWSEPVNITSQTKRKEWWLFAPAPGHGITLQDGTLVFPTQGRDKTGLPFSNITYSKDGGKTWKTSNPAYSDVTECMVAELSDGSLMLNMRDNRNHRNPESNGRNIATTSNLGETWTQHPTSHHALIEPTCMGSLHRHVYTENGEEKNLLLFANPDSKTERSHITLKASFDQGNTWPETARILLDEYSGFGYSCITSVNDSIIGILYESSQAQMVFQQIALRELNKDPI